MNAPSSGFSISMALPHLAQRVLAFGRSPSFVSSNLYLDWQLGQTMIIRAFPPAGPGAPDGWKEDNTNRAAGAGPLVEWPSPREMTPAGGNCFNEEGT